MKTDEKPFKAIILFLIFIISNGLCCLYNSGCFSPLPFRSYNVKYAKYIRDMHSIVSITDILTAEDLSDFFALVGVEGSLFAAVFALIPFRIECMMNG